MIDLLDYWPWLALFAPLCLVMLSLLSPPVWLSDSPLKPHWRAINLTSWGMSWLLSTLVGLAVLHESPMYVFVCILGTGLMTTVLGQTIFTDFIHRKADRRILRLATVLAFVAGLVFLQLHTNQITLTVYLLWFACATVAIFLPDIGTSDGRAIQLVVAAGFPILGFSGFRWGLIFLIVLLLLWGIGLAVRKRSIKKLFTEKISQPLVPIIIAPFLLAVLLFNTILY